MLAALLLRFVPCMPVRSLDAPRARGAGGGGKQLSVLNGMYGGLGQSLGALIGGALQVKLGTSHTFYVAALGDSVLLVLTLGWWALNPKTTRRDDAA